MYNIVIPYRNRPNCLSQLIDYFPTWLKKQPYITSFNILVVEQDFSKPFNLAKIINAGYALFTQAKLVTKDSVFIFQPVDCLPVSISYEVEAGFVGFCATSNGNSFYKACGVTPYTFESVNGFSNEFWGWGYEDVDMFLRLQARKLPTEMRSGDFKFLMDCPLNESKDIDANNKDKRFELKHKKRLAENKQNILMTMHTDGLSNLEFRELERQKLNEHITKVTISI